MSTREKLPKGHARIQFVANSERIKELSDQGYDIRKIYNKLLKEEKISMCYESFHDNFTSRRKKKKAEPINTKAPGASVLHASQPAAPARPKPRLVPAPAAISNSNSSHKKSLEELLAESLKDQEKYLNTTSSDQELKNEAERLFGN